MISDLVDGEMDQSKAAAKAAAQFVYMLYTLSYVRAFSPRREKTSQVAQKSTATLYSAAGTIRALGCLSDMRSSRCASRFISTSVLLGIFMMCSGLAVGCRCDQKREPPVRAQPVSPPILKVTATALKHTVVTPHLEHPIQKGTNVLWCITAQLAWNELCRLVGEPVRLSAEPEMAKQLNKRTASGKDLDRGSYVAMAGLAGDGILDRIRGKLRARFGASAVPLSLPTNLSPTDWVAYAYLSKSLPFRWAFKRSEMHIKGRSVAAFGIRQYLKSQKNEAMAASQVRVYDFRRATDFIVELKTRSEKDQLLLAKIPPKATLAKTIQSVLGRVASSKPTPMKQYSDLNVPVLDFEIIRDYRELTRATISSRNPRFDGSRIPVARQVIRFKLDETGAVLKSDSTFYKCATQNLDFIPPFLVLLKRRRAAQPYFALWVDNAELLVPFHIGSGENQSQPEGKLRTR